MATKPANKKSKSRGNDSNDRFEAAKIDALFLVLDAVAWLDSPRSRDIAQFADVDPRTVGKLLKNARQIGLVDVVDEVVFLRLPYPYKGTLEQKKAVVREALILMPLLVSVRQFVALGDPVGTALRKAATVAGTVPYDEAALLPLVQWAKNLNALEPGVVPEDLLEEATAAKAERHVADASSTVAFLSHSAKDKPFVRQLAADLNANDVGVWLDEQRVHVGDSIPEKVAQGLAESDYFVVIVSDNSRNSQWVAKELNSALVAEIERRDVHVLPIKLDDSDLPDSIRDKKYADFSKSYKDGLRELLASLKRKA